MSRTSDPELAARIVTPYTDPGRWDEEEKALFDRGLCSWQVAYGLGWPATSEYCGRPSKAGASFGYCAEHEAELLESHYPDGPPR